MTSFVLMGINVAGCTYKVVNQNGRKKVVASGCGRKTPARTFTRRVGGSTKPMPRPAYKTPAKAAQPPPPPPSSNGWCGDAMVKELISLNNGIRKNLPQLACDERACSAAAKWAQGQCQACVALSHIPLAICDGLCSCVFVESFLFAAH
jgi:hypothetical protein